MKPSKTDEAKRPKNIKHPKPEDDPPPLLPPAQVDGAVVQPSMERRVWGMAMKREGNGYRLYLCHFPQEVIDACMVRHDGPQLQPEASEFAERFVEAVAENRL